MRYIISGNEGHRIKKTQQLRKSSQHSPSSDFSFFDVYSQEKGKKFSIFLFYFLDDFFLRAPFVSEAELKEKSYSSCSFLFLFLYILLLS